MIEDRCVHVFPRQAREVIIGRFVDPWKDRKCVHGYRLAMRGSIRSATRTSTRRSDLERGGKAKEDEEEREEPRSGIGMHGPCAVNGKTSLHNGLRIKPY